MRIFNAFTVILLGLGAHALPDPVAGCGGLTDNNCLSPVTASSSFDVATFLRDAPATSNQQHGFLQVRKEPYNPKKQSANFKTFKKRVRVAHGALMGLAFLGFYPFASLMMRLFNFPYLIWVHAGIQLVAMLIMFAGMGCGIWFGRYDNKYFNSAHTQMGVVIPGLMALQPVFGFLHHRGYVKTGGRTYMSYIHANYGRILIFLGGVTGIIGRENEGKDYAHGQTIWSTLFAIITGMYLITLGLTAYLKRRAARLTGPDRIEIMEPKEHA